MPTTTHADHRFSVTIRTDDLAVVGCLRALSKHAQTLGNGQIPWGGTKDEDWRRKAHQVTFHFSSPGYRQGFLDDVRRLLPADLVTIVAQSDSDPARPQR